PTVPTRSSGSSQQAASRASTDPLLRGEHTQGWPETFPLLSRAAVRPGSPGGRLSQSARLFEAGKLVADVVQAWECLPVTGADEGVGSEKIRGTDAGRGRPAAQEAKRETGGERVAGADLVDDVDRAWRRQELSVDERAAIAEPDHRLDRYGPRELGLARRAPEPVSLLAAA